MKILTVISAMLSLMLGSTSQAQSFGEKNDPRPLVVMLYQDGPEGQAFGAGIVISQDDNRTIIATAAHNLYAGGDFFAENGPQPVELEFFTNRGVRFRALPLAKIADIDLDLAFIAVENATSVPRFDDTQFAILSETDYTSQTVSLLGQPQGSNWEMFTGARVLQPDINYLRIQMPSAAVVPGMSGGALLDSSNAITGMIVDTEGAVGRAIPIYNIVAFAQRFGLDSDLLTVSLRPDRRVIAETSAPAVRSAYVNSGLLLRLDLDPAVRTQFDHHTDERRVTALPGKTFVYVVDTGGNVFNLDDQLAAGQREIQLPAQPSYVEHCTIVTVPDGSGRFLYSAGQWPIGANDGNQHVVNQLTTNRDICIRNSRPLVEMRRPFGPTATVQLPLRMFHVFAIVPKTAEATIVGLSPWGGEHAEEYHVDSGTVTFFKSTNNVWKRFLALNAEVYLEGLFSKQNLRVPTTGFLVGQIAACTVRTLGAETFVGLTLFQGSTVANRSLRKTEISEATTPSERFNATRFFHVPGTRPCEEALEYLESS